MSGYQAFYEGAAWIDLSTRATLKVTGEDRKTWLHAMCSQEVEKLSPGEGGYAFFLNGQGHVLADANFYLTEDHVLLDTEPDCGDALVEHLEKFIIMDDVALKNLTGAIAKVAVSGPHADEIVQRALALPELPRQDHRHLLTNGIRVARDSGGRWSRLWLFTDRERLGELAGGLARAGAVEAAPEEAELYRVERRVPRLGHDISDSMLPHETQELRAVSFTKGCYLGQEIVERVRSQGRVNRLLTPIEIDSTEPPPSGSAAMMAGCEAGKVTSPFFSPKLGVVVGFALLRRNAVEQGADLEVGDAACRVRRIGGV